jgi:hypothetical protein
MCQKRINNHIEINKNLIIDNNDLNYTNDRYHDFYSELNENNTTYTDKIIHTFLVTVILFYKTLLLYYIFQRIGGFNG